MTRVLMASGNLGKIRELESLFQDPRLELLSMKDFVPPGFDVEETGATFEANARLKAVAVCEATGLPALADDSGLEVDALGGRPGVYSARFAGPERDDGANNRRLVQELEGVPEAERGARFRCVLALATPGTDSVEVVALAAGACEGRIVTTPRGKNGFGYDPYFSPLSDPQRTTAEMSAVEKNRISHRALAAKELLPQLRRYLDQWLE
ncbi:MAG: RdgB/HAM1 family non-canonical purine NTP pyrophosphatase [Polyangiaceae bacterium]|nr:RdgB/HAM1 family non-canonical purine NTP pyrophosphatase [Polyangiaceae bacterium]